MKQGNAIEVNNVTKNFKVFLDRSDNIKDYIVHSNRRKYERREVLKGISFEVKKGEAIGLVGRNGCGKSTTLKLLTRIMYPDSGSIEIEGRVSSLIELGAGFHPDMSGRENIYINASIFGLSKKEIDSRIDDIIEFSELEDYIDNPVRTYSSGMYMRLAFSVAINVDAEVLLIDEILAVGDANFQAKCFKKLREIKSQGTTIVIVSHALGQIEAICEKSIWIEKGYIKEVGDPRNVHREYLKFMGQERSEQNKETIDEAKDSRREGNHKVEIEEVRLFNDAMKECSQFDRGDNITVVAKYKVHQAVQKAYFAADIIREDDNMYCFATNTNFSGMEINLSRDGYIKFKLKNVQLMPQKYYIDFILKEYTTEPIDIIRNAVSFEMFSDRKGGGIAYIENEWTICDDIE